MIRRPPRSTPLYSSAASDVYKRQNFFSATYPDRLVTKVYLTGGASRSAFLKEMLAEKIGVDVEIFDPFEGLTVEDKAVDPSNGSKISTSTPIFSASISFR